MASVRRSVYLSALGRHASIGIGFVSIMVVARLLTPEEIGVFSVSAAFVALGHTLRDFGVANYLIQERDLTRERVGQAFGVALITAAAIAGLLVALSGPIAAFYRQPDMISVVLVLALGFLLIPLSVPGQALLRREMKFGAVIKVQVVSTLAQASTTMSLAYYGAGPLSMACGAVVGNIVSFGVLAVLYPAYAFTAPSFHGLGRVVRFGGFSSAANMYTRFGMLAPDFILGRMLGFDAVAFYSRGNGLINIFRKTVQAAVMPVALPAFAAEHRRDHDLKAPYIRAEEMMTVLSWPFYGFLGLMAFPIIRILYGPQWDAAVPIAQLLCIAAAIGALSLMSWPVLVATGNVKAIFYKEVIIQTARIAMIAAASFHSLEAVALAQIANYVIGNIVNYYYLGRFIELRLIDIWRSAWKSAVVSLVSLIGPLLVFLMRTGDGFESLIQSLLIAGASALLAWLAAVFALDHPIRIEVLKAFAAIRSIARTQPGA